MEKKPFKIKSLGNTKTVKPVKLDEKQVKKIKSVKPVELTVDLSAVILNKKEDVKENSSIYGLLKDVHKDFEQTLANGYKKVVSNADGLIVTLKDNKSIKVVNLSKNKNSNKLRKEYTLRDKKNKIIFQLTV